MQEVCSNSNQIQGAYGVVLIRDHVNVYLQVDATFDYLASVFQIMTPKVCYHHQCSWQQLQILVKRVPCRTANRLPSEVTDDIVKDQWIISLSPANNAGSSQRSGVCSRYRAQQQLSSVFDRLLLHHVQVQCPYVFALLRLLVGPGGTQLAVGADSVGDMRGSTSHSSWRDAFPYPRIPACCCCQLHVGCVTVQTAPLTCLAAEFAVPLFLCCAGFAVLPLWKEICWDLTRAITKLLLTSKHCKHFYVHSLRMHDRVYFFDLGRRMNLEDVCFLFIRSKALSFASVTTSKHPYKILTFMMLVDVLSIQSYLW